METLAFSNAIALKANFKTLRPVKCSVTPPSLVDHSAKFKEAAKHGNLVPLFRPIFSDHLTPVLAYRCLVKEDERDAPSFLFESVEPGLKASSVGRYSVIGAQPTMEIVAKENVVTIVDHHEGQRMEEFVEDPMVIPQRIMEKWKPQRIDELPDAFCVGSVCYPCLVYLTI
ncbi:UNVERIFIED_CONTAM: Anthranilate synthase alpha subunit, chloroplastic, partial [Sesamum calycinum]